MSLPPPSDGFVATVGLCTWGISAERCLPDDWEQAKLNNSLYLVRDPDPVWIPGIMGASAVALMGTNALFVAGHGA